MLPDFGMQTMGRLWPTDEFLWGKFGQNALGQTHYLGLKPDLDIHVWAKGGPENECRTTGICIWARFGLTNIAKVSLSPRFARLP